MELIKDWRDWWRWWSLRLTALGTMITGYLIAYPDAALNSWTMLPDEIKSFIPSEYMPTIGLVLVGAGQLARFLKQNQPKSVGAALTNAHNVIIATGKQDIPVNPPDGLYLYIVAEGIMVKAMSGKWYKVKNGNKKFN